MHVYYRGILREHGRSTGIYRDYILRNGNEVSCLSMVTTKHSITQKRKERIGYELGKRDQRV